MRFHPAEPDIATIFNRIMDGDIDLQPDFQRGEVWSITKQQRLIDSILRNWIIPPIIVISAANGRKQEVLDGQQRLASIRDFKLNKVRVDGRIEPATDSIKYLHGLTYAELPIEIQRAFDRSTIRIFEASDYSPDEPAEIFFRLNQPTALTSAEKRNAFYGPVRSQVRTLAEKIIASENTVQLLGFSNSRMAYDDVIARLGYILEFGTLNKKVTSNAVTIMYRRQSPLNENVFQRLDSTLSIFSEIAAHTEITSNGFHDGIRLSKATALSWLLFISRLDATGDLELITKFFTYFESARQMIGGHGWEKNIQYKLFNSNSGIFGYAIILFNDRASARVSDVSSVVLRDLVLWLCWYEYSKGVSAGSFEKSYSMIPSFLESVSSTPIEGLENELLNFASIYNWGKGI